MGTLFSLSKSATESMLGLSEWALLIFGILLVIGLIGEHKGIKSQNWKTREHLFSALVVIGVAGELLSDGGIFGFSRHLQTVSDLEVASVTKEAQGLRLQADQLEAQLKSQDPRKQPVIRPAEAGSAFILCIRGLFPLSGFQCDLCGKEIRVNSRLASASSVASC